MYKKFKIIHFVGIGGVGMSGIAEVLSNLGYEVRGSDIRASDTTKRLESLGISITVGHRAENISGSHVVVISSAIGSDNPEVMAAKEKSIPVIPRAEMLAELERLKYSVLVAGAHGKTTATSLTACALASGGLDPTIVIGGKLKGTDSNAKLGQGDFFVAEADESDGSFLKLSPTIAVVTNIDREHMDFFENISEIKDAFISFINKVPFYGISLLCADNEHVRELLPKVQRRFVTYGVSEGVDLTARNIKKEGLNSIFEAVFRDKSLGMFEIPMPGVHNVCNSLAAIGTAYELEIDMDNVREALRKFGGIQRRFELKGEVSGVRVFDDYAHHPAEIRATLKAAKDVMKQNTEHRTQSTDNKKRTGRLVALFQPHRYSRTQDLMGEFVNSFGDADKIILMDIYPAGEKPLNGVSSESIFVKIRDMGKDIIYMKDRAEIVQYLAEDMTNGDILLTLGAGDVWKTGEEFLKKQELKCDKRS